MTDEDCAELNIGVKDFVKSAFAFCDNALKVVFEEELSESSAVSLVVVKN